MQKNQGILLGVVGTDIPLQELMKLIPKHMVQQQSYSGFMLPCVPPRASPVSFSRLQLGIHGYVFAITNNGYILTHPDLRPLVTPPSLRSLLIPCLYPVFWFSMLTDNMRAQMCYLVGGLVCNPRLFL